MNPAVLALLRGALPAVRGLTFTTPVPVVALDAAGIRRVIAHDLAESYPGDELARLEAVYTRLGLIPPGTGLRAAVEGLYAQAGAGFYDPRTKRLVLPTTPATRPPRWIRVLTFLSGRDLLGEFVLAHELTHALQDQHWGVPVAPDPLTDAHGDRRIAYRAVLEGDATLAGLAWTRGDLDPATRRRIVRELDRLPDELAAAHPEVPEAIRSAVAFQYQAGTRFVAWAHAVGGWPAVDRVYADPPTSTEQVLHPARYFGHRDEPRPITLGGTEALETAGWTPIVEDTLGELTVRTLLRRGLRDAAAAAAADGWGGDRLRALARDDALLVVWMTVWDALTDADEFAAALPRVVPNSRIERRSDRVLVLLGPDPFPGDPAALARRVWTATRVGAIAAP